MSLFLLVLVGSLLSKVLGPLRSPTGGNLVHLLEEPMEVGEDPWGHLVLVWEEEWEGIGEEGRTLHLLGLEEEVADSEEAEGTLEEGIDGSHRPEGILLLTLPVEVAGAIDEVEEVIMIDVPCRGLGVHQGG